ncbi:hypothetical protein LCGC14_2554340 [marine sediment metagenome]|uniref:Uncharacterized protein n=1 Tax=marine sediment metagenome TaxID=412755 RepID=A0A0F9DF34_9ZZZZ
MIEEGAKLTVEQLRTDIEAMDKYPYPYRVRDATNTTIHKIGELLSTATVDDLISMGVTVKIVAPAKRRKA